MKERLVRGTSVENVVRALRSHAREHPLPPFGQAEQDLLRRTIRGTTWYSLKVFDSLLQITHRYVHDGSELAAQQMGRSAAQRLLDEGALSLGATPLDTLRALCARWREQFNFGEVQVEPRPPEQGRHGVRLRVTGYPDMSATHGHTLIGWTEEMIERSGGRDVRFRIEERPWMHNGTFTFTLDWMEPHEELECLDCGACCRQASDGRILVPEADLVRWRRLGRNDILAAIVPGHFGEQAFACNEGGACVHLGTAAQPNACSIYEDRGTTCREFEKGSWQCREFRRDAGLE